ncbi:unnamed protein product, partial [marine sediment metagenome]
ERQGVTNLWRMARNLGEKKKIMDQYDQYRSGPVH